MAGIVAKLRQYRRTRDSAVSEATLEKELFEREDSIRALPSAPERFEIEARLFEESKRVGAGKTIEWFLGLLPYRQAMFEDITNSFSSVDENPASPKRRVTARYLHDFEAHARSLGVGSVGYTDLPREAIFRGKAVLFGQVIVLTMEMDKTKMAKAPSRETRDMVLETYYQLGHVITILVDSLRQDGYAAQAGHPLNGVTLYPLLGQRAGLGWCGRLGLLITPEFGPRHRLGVIYTNIENLPVAQGNDHAWIADLCVRCRQCIRMCPGHAIYEAALVREPGYITHIDAEKCFPEFVRKYGCSICVNVCPFNKHSYRHIKTAFLKPG